jgi:hypothetical protein
MIATCLTFQSAIREIMQLFLLDSIANIGAEMQGHIVVSGSHGGRSAAQFALEFPPKLVVFNDAGAGLDSAGIAGLTLLDARGIAALAVAHTSARIGDAASTLETGIITHVNSRARELDIEILIGEVGARLQRE